MKRNILLSILFFVALIVTQQTKGQNDANINIIDSIGFKQGIWIEYDSIDIEGFINLEQLVPDSTENTDNQTNAIVKYELIKHIGIYKNSRKEGIWKIYKPNNVQWMKVFYKNGFRSKIEVFYKNGNILYSIEKENSDNFIVKEYSKSGSLINKQYKKSEFVNNIDEVKLFILGY